MRGRSKWDLRVGGGSGGDRGTGGVSNAHFLNPTGAVHLHPRFESQSKIIYSLGRDPPDSQFHVAFSLRLISESPQVDILGKSDLSLRLKSAIQFSPEADAPGFHFHLTFTWAEMI